MPRAQITKALVPEVAHKCKNPACPNIAKKDKHGRPREFCSKLCEMTAIKCGFVIAGPTKYVFHLKYCEDLLNEFLEWCEEKNGTEFIPVPGPPNKDGSPTVSYLMPKNKACLPTIAQYARWLEKYKKVSIPTDVLEYWASTRPAFGQAYKKMKAMQDILLTNGSLSRTYSNEAVEFQFARLGVYKPAAPKEVSFHNHYHLDAIRKIYEMADQIDKKLYGQQ